MCEINTHRQGTSGQRQMNVCIWGGELKQGMGEDCRTREGLFPIGQPGKAYGITQEEKGRPSLSLDFQFLHCGKFHSFPVSMDIYLHRKQRKVSHDHSLLTWITSTIIIF